MADDGSSQTEHKEYRNGNYVIHAHSSELHFLHQAFLVSRDPLGVPVPDSERPDSPKPQIADFKRSRSFGYTEAKAVLEKLAAIQVLEVCFLTTDGRQRLLRRKPY